MPPGRESCACTDTIREQPQRLFPATRRPPGTVVLEALRRNAATQWYAHAMTDSLQLQLRCSPAELAPYAERYAYPDAALAEKIGADARERGWYTRDEYITMRRWKSPRGSELAKEADETLVCEITRVAFTASSERLRLKTLLKLPGTGVPVASTLLHFGHPDPYPLIDARALWTLGVEHRLNYYPFATWMAYVECCRDLSTQTGMSMRTLDRALWQYSKEHQGTIR